MRLRPSTERVVYPLAEDVDLVAELDAREAAAARRIPARAVVAKEGQWQPPVEERAPSDAGLLVVEGLLTRDVLISGIGCTELLGKGDLVQPRAAAEGEPSVPTAVDWSVLETTTFAVIDDDFVAAISGWPSVTRRICARAIARSQTLAMHLAITCLVGLDLRLYVLFWHLADRFGHVERDGAVVPLRLTHDTLARLVAARRPSVTSAIGELRERTLLVHRRDGSWLVRGDPSAEIESMLSDRRRRARRSDVRGHAS